MTVFDAQKDLAAPTVLDVVTGADPFPCYATVRAAPPARCARTGLWLVARHADLQQALADPALHVRPPAAPGAPWLAGGPAAILFRQHVRMSDGADHRARRERLLAGLRTLPPTDRLAGIAGAQVGARLAGRPPGMAFDAMADLAVPLPPACIARWLGLPDAAADRVAAEAVRFAPALLPWSGAAEIAAAQDAAARLIDMLETPARESRLPFFAALTDPAAPGRPLTIGEAVAAAAGLLAQSCEATTGLVGLALLAVLRDPALAPVLQGDGAGALLCEVMRFDPPIHNTRRTAAAAVTIGGAAVPAGDGLLLLLAAGGRDGAAYADPDSFVADRFLAPQVPPPPAFGAGGHRCPGSGAALAIAGGALAALLRDRPSLALLESSIAWRPSQNARIPARLPVA